MSLVRSRTGQRRTAPRNRDFANQVRGFVKRALALPGMPLLPLLSIAAALLLTLVGGFGTGAIAPPGRLCFWAALMTINCAKWQLWFLLTVRRPEDWRWSTIFGAVLLNLTLPIEIVACLWLIGIDAQVAIGGTWASALAISTVIFALIVALRRHTGRPVAAVSPGSAAIPTLLLRAGITCATDLQAIEAEDHYCRLHLADGRSTLIHHRFGDALAQVAGFDGIQVHRGAWVAAQAVRGARREGRRWRLVLGNDVTVPVSARFATAVRARGWLRAPQS